MQKHFDKHNKKTRVCGKKKAFEQTFTEKKEKSNVCIYNYKIKIATKIKNCKKTFIIIDKK